MFIWSPARKTHIINHLHTSFINHLHSTFNTTQLQILSSLQAQTSNQKNIEHNTLQTREPQQKQSTHTPLKFPRAILNSYYILHIANTC